MKTTLLVLTLCLHLTCAAQLVQDPRDLRYVFKTDLSAKEAFRIMQIAIPKKHFYYDRYVVNASGKYYQPGWMVGRKKKMHVMRGMESKKVRI